MVYVKKRKRHIMRRICLVLAGILIFSVLLLAYLNHRIDHVMEEVVRKKLENTVTELVNLSVEETLADESFAGQALVAVQYGADGKISAITANSFMVNRLRAAVSLRIQEKLAALVTDGFSLSYADLFGEGMISSFFPRHAFSVVIEPVGAVNTDVRSDFSSAGINQTKHTVVLSVEIGTVGLIKGKTVETRTATSLCIAETVIVGDVPLIWLGTEK